MIDQTNTSNNLARIWKTLRPSVARSWLAVFLSVLTLICAIGLIVTSGWLISRAWQQPPIAFLTLAIVGVRAFGIGKGVFKYFERLVSHSNALRGLTALRIALVDRIAVVAPVGVAKFRNGDTMRRLVTDVDNVSEFGLRVVLPRTTAILAGGLVVLLAALLNPLVAVVLLCGLLVAGIVAPFVAATVAQQHVFVETELQGKLAAQLNWQFQAVREITAANAQQRVCETVSQLDSQVRQTEKRSARSMGLASAIAVAAQGLSLLGVVLVSVPAVRNGQLDNGVYLASVVLLPLVAFEIVAGLASAALATVRAQASSDRLAAILDEPDPVPDASTVTQGVPPVAEPNQGVRVTLNDVTITWPGNALAAVSDFSLDIPAGQVTVLLGPSGCGKSTIAAALVKFIKHEGTIAVDGVDIDRLPGDEVRQVIKLSEQNPYLFNNTLAENVRLARPDASDEEIVLALEHAGAGPWIRGLPAGIHTLVGQYGTQLSGGQRQRVALARIELSQPSVAIFDEPTAHLDRESATEILNSIFENQGRRTTLLITHSHEGLERASQVVEIRPKVQILPPSERPD